jgi:hypothetical protein
MTTDDSAPPETHDGYAKARLGKNPRQLLAMCDSELVVWQANHSPGSPQFSMAEREWQRRLIVEQVNATWRAAIIGGVFALIGTAVGAWLTHQLQQDANSNPSAQVAQANKSNPAVEAKQAPTPVTPTSLPQANGKQNANASAKP